MEAAGQQDAGMSWALSWAQSHSPAVLPRPMGAAHPPPRPQTCVSAGR